MPLSPGAAAMPERGARIPMRSGLFCAMAGAEMPADTDAAPSAAADARSLRREMTIVTPPSRPSGGRIIVVCLAMIYQTHVSNKPMSLQKGGLIRGEPKARGSGCGLGAQEIVDFGAGQSPIVVEIGHHGPHERL